MTKKAVAQDGGLFASQPQHVSVGIDASYSGFAICAMGVEEYAPYYAWLFKSKLTGPDRLNDIREFVVEVLAQIEETHTVWEIGIEGYAFGSQNGREIAGELAGMVKLIIWDQYQEENRRYPTIIPPTSLKKFITGSGAAKKEQLLLQTYKKYQIEFNDNNLCDAYGISRMIRALDSDQESLLVYERDALNSLTRMSECPKKLLK